MLRNFFVMLAIALTASLASVSQTRAIDSMQRLLARTTGSSDSLDLCIQLGKAFDLVQSPATDTISRSCFRTAQAIAVRTNQPAEQLLTDIFLTPAPTQPAMVDSSIIRLKAITEKARAAGIRRVEALGHARLGHLFIYKDSATAQQELNRSIVLHTELGDHLGVARAQTALANLFFRKEYYENALKYCRKAFTEYGQAAPGFERDFYLGYTHLLMGYCYQILDSSAREEECYRNAEPLIAVAVANKIRFTLYSYWARMKVKEKQLHAGIVLHKKAYAVCLAAGNRSDIATCLYDIAKVHLLLNQHPQALEAIQKASDITLQIKDPFARGKNYYHIAEVQADLGQTEPAIQSCNNAMDAAQIGGFADLKVNVYRLLQKIYVARRDQANAYRYLDSASTMQINQLRADKRRELAAAQQKIENKWAESALKAKNEKLNMLQEQSRLNNRLFLLVVLLVLAVAAFVILAVNRSRLIARKEMEEQLKEEQRKNALSAVKAHEEERQKIARELHDGVGAYLSALKMNFNKLRETTDIPTLPDIERSLDRLSQEIRTISENLVSATLRDYGLAIATEELAELISQAGKVQVTTQFDESTDSIPTELALTSFRIIQELVNNALKHSNASQITINAAVEQQELKIVVSDNGSESQRSGDSQGTGLKDISNRLRIYNGNINLRSAAGSGTQAQITIPIANF